MNNVASRLVQTGAARPLAIAGWLFGVASLVGLIVVVGGITRLTESGLSITEWKPVTGVLPPLSEAQWQAEFAAYQRIPQFTEINGPAGMALADYKFIYIWEWVHRLLARLVGMAFALPLAWFWIRQQIPKGFKPRLLLLLALGGMQGVIGWWMVSSGLSQDVKVSHFRLATHLMVALLTLGALIWTALDMRALARGQAAARLTRFSAVVLVMLAIQLAYGALVAGLRAGHVAADWPLMQGQFFPAGIDWSQGLIHAMISDPFLVHFIHRWWAWILVAALIVMARKLRRADGRAQSLAIHSAFGVQILLGIATAMSGVELWLAVMHQLTGAMLVAATAWGAHALGRQR